ncbi:hypothetical protein E2C01_046878 [Portunus trituberculatus]|uniref:Secreted protein n=1 Tax=Portunus trituberculatus TaxID=210409 RepID=A0A5B7G8Y8_PORTR|nr:hypothetical protein [Portunus trituberculatus]
MAFTICMLYFVPIVFVCEAQLWTIQVFSHQSTCFCPSLVHVSRSRHPLSCFSEVRRICIRRPPREPPLARRLL